MQASTVVVLLNVLFFVLLALGIFIGIKRGLKYSALHFGLIIVGLVISIVITQPVTNLVLGMKIIPGAGGNISIEQAIMNALGTMSNASPTLTAVSNGIPAALLSPFVLVILSLIMCALLETFYQLFTRLYMRKKDKAKSTTKKNSRFVGGVFGIAEMFVFIILLLMPITSLGQTIQELSQDPVIVAEESQSSGTISSLIKNYIPEELLSISEEFNSSALGQIAGMGGLNHVFYDGVTNIKTEDSVVSFREDVVPTIKEYDKLIEIASQYADDFASADFNSIKVAVQGILDSNLIQEVLQPILKDFIKNKEELLASATIDYDLQYALSDVLDNLEIRLQSTDFVLHDYVKEAVNGVVDAVEQIAQNNLLDPIMELFNGRDANFLMTHEAVSTLSKAIDCLIDLTVAEDLFPLMQYGLYTMPAAISNIVEINYFENFEILKNEAPKVFDIAVAFADINTVNGNLLRDLIYGEPNFIKTLLNSENATEVIVDITKAKSIKGAILSAFYEIDKQVVSAIKNVDSSVVINNSNFKDTISYSDSVQLQDAFVDKLAIQAQELVDIGRFVYNNGINSNTIGQLLDMLKGSVAKYLDEDLNSNGVFDNNFNTLINFFNGTIKQDKSENSAFAKADEFNMLVDEQFERINEDGKYEESMKYYLVSYQDIFAQLSI